jgi:hypothetical protein
VGKLAWDVKELCELGSGNGRVRQRGPEIH